MSNIYKLHGMPSVIIFDYNRILLAYLEGIVPVGWG
jgi:hypothetical protein